MKDKYFTQIEILTNEILKDKINICDYTHYDQSNEFQYVFDYLSLSFSSQSQKYKIRNPLLFYSNYDSLNACAIKSDHYNIIVFNRGLILNLINEILENDNLIEFNTVFKNTEEYLNIKIERLIFQFTILFTFYHEFAHLLQNNHTDINMSEETSKIQKEEIKDSHYKELDADAYSAVHLARHIDEYCVKSFEKSKIKESIIGITAVFCSNLLFYLLRFPSAKKDLYFEDNTHPHTYIRILNIISNIARYITADINLIDLEIHITKEDLFEPMFNEVNRLEAIYDNKLNSFRKIVDEQIEEIIAYITLISKNKPANINSAIEVYNSHI